jgi:hypothetical protein
MPHYRRWRSERISALMGRLLDKDRVCSYNNYKSLQSRRRWTLPATEKAAAGYSLSGCPRSYTRRSAREPAWSIAASTLRWFISCRLLLALHPLLQRPHDLQIQRAAILASQIVEALLERTRHAHGDDGRFLFRWSCSCHTIIIATGERTTSRARSCADGSRRGVGSGQVATTWDEQGEAHVAQASPKGDENEIRAVVVRR